VRFDDNASCWLDELAPWEPGPALARDLTADVVIVGGGLTGISTAWHLSGRFPDRRIVLLEAATLANGASGRNGGQVLNGINGVEPRDEAEARRVHEATSLGIDTVEALAAASTLDAGFARDGCLEASTTARSAEQAQRRVEKLTAWGIPLRWLPAAATGVHGAHGAVLDPAAARVNSAALVRGLRGPLRERGVEIYEKSPVRTIREGRTCEVVTATGTVRAAAVVLATNAYTPALGYFRGGILPLHSPVVATPPLPEAVWKSLGWGGHVGFSDDLDRIAYGCRTPGGRLLFGGGSNAAYAYLFGGSPVLERPSPRSFAAIENRLAHYFPGLPRVGIGGASGIAPAVAAAALKGQPSRVGHGDALSVATGAPVVAARWSGPLAITLDRVCSMGVTGRHRNVYHALGYSGHGLALAALAGRVLCDLYAGDHARWQGLPFFQRRLRWIPPEPMRWIGYQLYTRATGRSPRTR
jgi:gamma-glutamylputrescine oxidase